MTDSRKWAILKKQLADRPLLPFTLGMTIEECRKYSHSTPPSDYIDKINAAIEEDRKSKTHRIKIELGKIVGYRESCIYAKKFNISDTTMRKIIEGEKTMVGYDVIDKMEIWLNFTTGMTLSIENPLTPQRYIKAEFDKIDKTLNEIALSLLQYPRIFRNSIEKMDFEPDYQGKYYISTYLRRHAESIQQIADWLQNTVDQFQEKDREKWNKEIVDYIQYDIMSNKE
ncbi:hypothetical protein [Bacteroides uniformis]|jgi:hypothetical protein|uniref:Uncharacterized protein n=1 Tax=Bacteroides uniformis TaxID=820 RepID=A0A3E4R1P7_BACUN|nr:hypothetical protein [Bacteroides uniformis]RGL13358.1 hypothetical protein DXC80_10395 [Bacteroides uniformis]DAE79970.1 MAG TPA: hypothetical protein [Caudoviricetes sp.]DAE79981.1 MAG TPA: hypothetical protein [Caudoviricetes sp.]